MKTQLNSLSFLPSSAAQAIRERPRDLIWRERRLDVNDVLRQLLQ
jgi:hypothetical protein